MGIQGFCAANLYFQLLGQIPGWRIFQDGSTLPTPTSAVWGNSPHWNTAGDWISDLENIWMQSPGGYLGIEELAVNLLVGLPEELALFSEFKHCVCRTRRNLLKSDVYFHVLHLPFSPQIPPDLTDLPKPRNYKSAHHSFQHSQEFLLSRVFPKSCSQLGLSLCLPQDSDYLGFYFLCPLQMKRRESRESLPLPGDLGAQGRTPGGLSQLS